MTTDFIQAKLMVKYNKGIDCLNAIAEGTRVFSNLSKEDDTLIGNSDFEWIKEMLKIVRRERIVRYAPQEVQTRLEESGLELTWENVIEESKYLTSVIEDGGSYYEEEDTTEVMATMAKIITWEEKAK